MLRILRLGTWRSADTDQCLVKKGADLNELMLIYKGKACVVIDGKRVAELQPGQFIGGISFVTKEITPADVLSLESIEYFVWPKTRLKDFLGQNPELHAALQSTLAIDFTRWLSESWKRA